MVLSVVVMKASLFRDKTEYNGLHGSMAQAIEAFRLIMH
jgi:hypothetical protein